MKILHLWP
jgi:hypothetical protein